MYKRNCLSNYRKKFSRSDVLKVTREFWKSTCTQITYKLESKVSVNGVLCLCVFTEYGYSLCSIDLWHIF